MAIFDTKSTPHAAIDHGVSSTEYRDAIGRFLTGVTVVSTECEGVKHGITASAVASVTLEPPTVLICLNRLSATGEAVRRSGHFAINVLNDTQEPLARHFASKAEDKFATIEHIFGRLGDPLLPAALAQLECEVSAHNQVGSHHIFFGRVIDVHCQAGAPLGYFRGQFISPKP